VRAVAPGPAAAGGSTAWDGDLNAGAHLPPPCPANCSQALQQACPALNRPSAAAGACLACLENHSTSLLRSGCTQDGALAWCAGAADDPYVFLCVGSGGGGGGGNASSAAITELVAFSTPSDADPDEACPSGGWEKVSGNLNSGSKNIGAQYLCVRRGGHGPGIRRLGGLVAAGGANGCPAGSSPVLGTPPHQALPFDFDPKGVGVQLCANPPLYSCADDAGCQLNGACTNRVCKCYPGWRGEDCGLLDMKPSVPSDFPGLAYGSPPSDKGTGGLASWGGSIVVDPKDKQLFHLFAAEMSLGCGLNSWYRNSIIIHGTSSSPLGPFVRKEQVSEKKPACISAHRNTPFHSIIVVD
jgi:hypothetical protein